MQVGREVVGETRGLWGVGTSCDTASYTHVSRWRRGSDVCWSPAPALISCGLWEDPQVSRGHVVCGMRLVISESYVSGLV